MSIPPSVLSIRIAGKERKAVRLWIPVFLFWPLLLVLVIVTLVLTIVLDTLLFFVGRRYHRYTKLILECMHLLTAMRGLQIYVDDEETTFKVSIR